MEGYGRTKEPNVFRDHFVSRSRSVNTARRCINGANMLPGIRYYAAVIFFIVFLESPQTIAEDDDARRGHAGTSLRHDTRPHAIFRTLALS